MRPILNLLLIATLSACSPALLESNSNAGVTGTVDQPNILVIVVDDLAYTDLGIYGGEISTPNIDALARQGTLLNTFYSSATCSPTRSMLLSGADNHVAGLGTMNGYQMADQEGKPGYLGYLNHKVAALPELLAEAGYRTYMTGKWHLGATEETGPWARGFDSSFVLLDGGAGAFANRLQIFGPDKAKYRDNGATVETLPADFYSTRFYTERMIRYIEEGKTTGKPFFAYLAYTSPHWPMQAPRESIERYRGKYDGGYDALRATRLANLKRLALIDEETEPFPRVSDAVAWKDLSAEQQAYQARIMEIYAAMVDDVDRYIGRLVEYLKSSGQYDNTLIFLMSDNGPEGNDLTNLRATVTNCCNNSLANIGNPDSYVWLGSAWAQAGNVPLRMYKAYLGDGGIRVPAFFHFPKEFPGGRKIGEITHVMDVTPTLLGAAGIEHPSGGIFQGRKVEPISGHSLLALLRGEVERVHSPEQAFGFELFGRRAIRQGDWKAVYVPTFDKRTAQMPVVKLDAWQLYNLVDDPAEMDDKADTHPLVLTRLLGLWNQYVEENNIILPDEAEAY